MHRVDVALKVTAAKATRGKRPIQPKHAGVMLDVASALAKLPPDLAAKARDIMDGTDRVLLPGERRLLAELLAGYEQK